MKKKVMVVVAVLFVTVNLSAQVIESLVSQYIDASYKNTEFLVRNPLMSYLYDYYPNLENVKGKIVKETKEDYRIWGNGNKAYGDTDIPYTCTWYYFFDQTGHITDRYYIYLSEDGTAYYKTHDIYSFTAGEYVITSEDMNKQSSNVKTYTISQNEDSLIFSNMSGNKEYQYSFNKDAISIITLKDGQIDSKDVYTFQSDEVKKSTYQLRNGNLILDKESIYRKGSLMEELDYLADGSLRFRRMFDTVSGPGIITAIDSSCSISERYIERRRSVAGFVEYEITRPLTDGDNGSYTIKTKEILETPDTFFIENFK